jgi:hypothetical protein
MCVYVRVLMCVCVDVCVCVNVCIRQLGAVRGSAGGGGGRTRLADDASAHQDDSVQGAARHREVQ